MADVERSSIFASFMRGKGSADAITPAEERSVVDQIVDDEQALARAEIEARTSEVLPLKPGEIERRCPGCGQVYRGLPESARMKMYKSHARRHPTHAGFGR